MEKLAGRLLLGGVWIASGCLLSGLAMWLMGAALAGPLLNAGLVILMATPVLRVLLSVVDYARARDWTFAATAIVVLAILVLSVVYSRSKASGLDGMTP